MVTISEEAKLRTQPVILSSTGIGRDVTFVKKLLPFAGKFEIYFGYEATKNCY